MKLCGLIFDLDGTLLDTLADIAAAENAALTELGLPVRPVDEYRLIVGGGAEDIAQRLLPQSLQATEHVKSFVERFRQHYRENWHSQTKPYRGIRELLIELEKAPYRLAVLSNKPEEFVRQIAAFYFLDNHNLSQPVHFTHIVGQHVDKAAKPDPGVALQIAADWGLKPDQIGLVGDSDIDMLTARNAGMVGIGACWGFRGREELEVSGAHILLQTPLDLLNYLA